MSEVNPTDTRIINDAEDVIDTYCCAGSQAMTGVEVEPCFFDPQTMEIMSPPQNTALMTKAVEKFGPGSFNNEPSSDLLEANSFPATFDKLQSIFDDVNAKLAFLQNEAAAMGLKRSWFQDMPHKSAAELLQNVVEVERYQAFFNPPREDMMDIAAYFVASKSTQVSISYINYEHMLANVRRLYLLAPFLFLLTDNYSAFDQGKLFTGQSGMMHRSSMGKRGGFPPYVFTAENGEEYIQSHIKHVMTNPMYVYYDENGILQRLPSGTWWTFEKDLKEKGLNTASNYFLSESILWPDVKIAALKDDQGKVINHRYEARMFGVGIHQHQTALLIVAGLAFNEDFADKTDGLLRSYGLCTKDCKSCIARLRTAYANAQNHAGMFFEIGYGSGLMADFAKQFAELLEEAYTSTPYEQAIAPALTICRTGYPDGKVNRLLFKTLEDVNAHQKNYDPALFTDPTKSAYEIFEQDILKKKIKSHCHRNVAN